MFAVNKKIFRFTFFNENNDFFLKNISQNNTMCLGCFVRFTFFAISNDGYFIPCRRIGVKDENLLSTKNVLF